MALASSPGPLPDLRPLLINLLSRHLIQIQLEACREGQRSYRDWSQVLEVLCATVLPPTSLSHTTLQFIRYVSLLEQVQKVREGQQQSSQALTEVLKLLSNLCKSPELKEPSVKQKLASLVRVTVSGLKTGALENYSKMVLDFVTTAMEWYQVKPSISLAEEAFEVRKERLLESAHQQEPTGHTPSTAGEASAQAERGTPPPKPSTPEHEAAARRGGTPGGRNRTAIRTVKGSGVRKTTHNKAKTANLFPRKLQDTVKTDTDVTDTSTAEQHKTAALDMETSFKRAQKSAPSDPGQDSVSAIGAEEDKTKSATVKPHLEFEPELLPLKETVSPQPNDAIGSGASSAPLVKEVALSEPCITTLPVITTSKMTLVGGGGGGEEGEGCILITYPTMILDDSSVSNSNSQGEAATSRDGDQASGAASTIIVGEGEGSTKLGIFNRSFESGAEMEWSSDESTCIRPLGDISGQESPARAIVALKTTMPAPVPTPTRSFIRKGAWSEEESRCLLEGVEKYGEGKWKEIRAESYSVLKHRTTNQLKDKYRNIKGRAKHYN